MGREYDGSESAQVPTLKLKRGPRRRKRRLHPRVHYGKIPRVKQSRPVVRKIAMLRPNVRPQPRKPSCTTPRKGKKTKSVVFRDWVEHDDGDVSNQEFPERYRSDDHGKKGVSVEYAKEDQYQESITAASRAAKAGELWENHVRGKGMDLSSVISNP